MTFQQMECFLAAAKTGSFSKAAQMLYMTQPTFGRQIAMTERELGYPLFVRTTQGNVLTPGGRILAERLPDWIAAYESILTEAKAAQLDMDGRINLGLLEGQLLDGRTNHMLEAFREAHPHIRVEVTRFSFRSMLTALREGALDIGVTLLFDVKGKPGFDYRHIYTIPNELVFSADHPLAGVPGVKLSDFSDDTFIDLAPEESGPISALLTQTCRDAGFEPEMIRVPDLKTQVQYVERGLGIAAFNKYHMACNHPSLTHIPLPDFPPVDFCAVWLADITNPAVRLFVDWLDQQNTTE